MKIGKEKDNKPNILKTYTDAELEAFDKEIDAYREEKTLMDGSIVRPINYRKLHIDKKTMSSAGAVYVETDIVGDYMGPTRFQRLESKIEQHGRWKLRKEYAEKMRMKNLQETANQI